MSSISKGLTEAFDLAAMQQEYRIRKAEILKNADMYSKKYDIPTDAKHFAEKVMSKQEHESNVAKSNLAREKAKKEYEANQAKQLEHDKENIDLLKAKLAKLQSSFDPNYEYSDDHTFWSTQKDIASKISSLKKRISRVEGEKLDELSTEKLAQYKTAAAADAGKADIAGDYKKADKRFSGIVKATKKQFANDTKTVKEADGQKEFILYINNKPAAKYVGQLQAERDMAAVKKKHPQVRIELKHEVCDLETVKKINENQLMGNALLEAKSLLTQLDESTQQQVINILKKNVDDEKGAFKTGYPRINNPKILGTNNKAKSIYYPPSKPNVKKLDKPLPESLGDQLKSKSIEALQQVKQKLEQQRMADLEQWEKDFKQNTVAKFTARQPSFMQQQPKQVAKPLEKHSVLKARLVQLNKAIEKQAILDKMLQRLDNKGLLTPAIQSDTDTSMLVRDGASDNYVSLNQKLDKALEFVKNRLLTNKAAFAKPKAIDENEELDENLHQWFKEKWVRFGPDGKIRGDCARGDDSEGKPKCLPQKKAQALGKKGRASAAARKRREDPNPERSGKAINVNTKKKTNEAELDEACWKGYHKEGNKKMFGKTYPNCVKNTNEEQEHHSESCPHCGGEMVSEELMNEKKDACYYKVKSRYKVWPSAYASGALVKCRKKGASNWGNGGKSNESIEEDDAGDVEQRFAAKIEKEKQRLAKLKQTDPEAYKREIAKSKTSGRVPPVSTFEDQGVTEGDIVPFKQKNPLTPNLIKQLKALSQQALELFWEGSSVPTAAQGQIAQIGKNEEQRMFKQNEAQFKALGYEYSIFEDDMDILFLHSIAREAWYEADKPANMYRGLPDLQYNAETNTLSYYDLIGDDGYEYTDNTQFEGLAEDQLDEKWSKKYKDSINCSNPKGFSQKAHCAGKQKNESAIMKGLKE